MTDSYQFTPTKRIGPFWKGLVERGCEVEEAQIDNKVVLRITTPNGNTWLTSTNISYPFASKLTYEIANDKQSTYQFVATLGIRTPKTIVCRSGDDMMEAERFMSGVAGVVVKPNDSFGSQGVTVGVNSTEELKVAMVLAKRHDSKQSALLQEYMSGDEYRFTILDGKVISVLLRQSARVTGNGAATVEALIAAENDRRKLDNQNRQFINYPVLENELIDAVDLAHTPAEGEVVIINRSSMVSGGASAYEVIDHIHKSYIELALGITKSVGTYFAAIDIFIDDPKLPLSVSNYCFNEINLAPATKLYYAARNRDTSHVPDSIIDRFIEVVDSL